MSHRVTTKTEIKDKAIAIAALKAANYTYVEQGDTLRVTSGPMDRAVIHLKTGEVVGDTDVHNKSDDSLGALKQRYTEAKFRRELQLSGGEIMSSVTNKDGDIVLRCKASFG